MAIENNSNATTPTSVKFQFQLLKAYMLYISTLFLSYVMMSIVALTVKGFALNPIFMALFLKINATIFAAMNPAFATITSLSVITLMLIMVAPLITVAIRKLLESKKSPVHLDATSDKAKVSNRDDIEEAKKIMNDLQSKYNDETIIQSSDVAELQIQLQNDIKNAWEKLSPILDKLILKNHPQLKLMIEGTKIHLENFYIEELIPMTMSVCFESISEYMDEMEKKIKLCDTVAELNEIQKTYTAGLTLPVDSSNGVNSLHSMDDIHINTTPLETFKSDSALYSLISINSLFDPQKDNSSHKADLEKASNTRQKLFREDAKDKLTKLNDELEKRKVAITQEASTIDTINKLNNELSKISKVNEDASLKRAEEIMNELHQTSKQYPNNAKIEAALKFAKHNFDTHFLAKVKQSTAQTAANPMPAITPTITDKGVEEANSPQISEQKNNGKSAQPSSVSMFPKEDSTKVQILKKLNEFLVKLNSITNIKSITEDNLASYSQTYETLNAEFKDAPDATELLNQIAIEMKRIGYKPTQQVEEDDDYSRLSDLF